MDGLTLRDGVEEAALAMAIRAAGEGRREEVEQLTGGRNSPAIAT